MEDKLDWQRPKVRNPACKANKGLRECGEERANFRGLVMNGMMEKIEKNIRNDPKILRLIEWEKISNATTNMC